jgi:hypothetical protein
MKSYKDEMNFGFLAIRDLTKEILDKKCCDKTPFTYMENQISYCFYYSSQGV